MGNLRKGSIPMISALLPNYARAELAFERGDGAWLWTVDGRRFLDFGSGIATASLGHGHPHLSKAIAEQAAKVMHVSNLYRIPGAETLAQRLVDATFADSVFFCNSGAEANEGMIKMMRRAMFDAGKPERFRFVVFEGAFHGRTLATLAAGWSAAKREPFEPVPAGFGHVPRNDLAALEQERNVLEDRDTTVERLRNPRNLDESFSQHVGPPGRSGLPGACDSGMKGVRCRAVVPLYPATAGVCPGLLA